VDINEPVSMAQNFANFIERLGSARQGNIELPGVEVETIKQITDSAKSQERRKPSPKMPKNKASQPILEMAKCQLAPIVSAGTLA
jgi:hypothetical protein